MTVQRDDRLGQQFGSTSDQRSPAQIDRDRILYSTAFRRLAGVTQVVSPVSGEVFHNRLTHSLKVAQIARRIAEMLTRDEATRKRADAWGGLDPDVVEAAALAHDLGHPPFGHIAEDELNRLIQKSLQHGDEGNSVEGYEGNAQSFRIVSALAVRGPESPNGLNLTRATLRAILKYPRLGSSGDRKYGAYEADRVAYEFAMELGAPNPSPVRSLEAQIMDWADDIAYSIHDTEDFYRAGLIPLDRLAANTQERTNFRKAAFERWKRIDKPFDMSFVDIFDNLFQALPIKEPFRGTRSQQEQLYQFVSDTISRYVQKTSLLDSPGNNGEGLSIPPAYRMEIDILKELTWHYVIENPALASHQHGQRLAIRTIYQVLEQAGRDKNWAMFPASARDEARQLSDTNQLDASRLARLVADTIAAMSDQQVTRLHLRLAGAGDGLLLDPF